MSPFKVNFNRGDVRNLDINRSYTREKKKKVNFPTNVTNRVKYFVLVVCYTEISLFW